MLGLSRKKGNKVSEISVLSKTESAAKRREQGIDGGEQPLPECQALRFGPVVRVLLVIKITSSNEFPIST